MNLHECRDMVMELLNQLPALFDGNHETGNALGTALQAAFKLMVRHSDSQAAYPCLEQLIILLVSQECLLMCFHFLTEQMISVPLCVCVCVCVWVCKQKKVCSRAKLCQAPPSPTSLHAYVYFYTEEACVCN